jgi:hypothetical protein
VELAGTGKNYIPVPVGYSTTSFPHEKNKQTEILSASRK